MASKRTQYLTRLEVPHPQCAVGGSGDGTTGIGCYRHGGDLACMDVERVHCLSALQIPYSQCAIIRRRDGASRDVCYRYSANQIRMSFQGADQRATWRCKTLLQRSEPGTVFPISRLLQQSLYIGHHVAKQTTY